MAKINNKVVKQKKQELAAKTTKIEWCKQTWNPITGCTPISLACEHCYAKRMAHRLHAMGNPRYINEFQVTLHWDMIEKPLHWKKPSEIFLCSMSDIMHKDVPDKFIERVFEVMNKTPQHRYYVLTKRPKRLVELSGKLKFTENIWAGVTVEHDDYTWRIDELRKVPAMTRFLSVEPLLGPMDNLNLKGIQWAIVGGQTGPGARLMDVDWARGVRDQCNVQGVAFFFKKHGGTRRYEGERLLDGRIWEEYPEVSEDEPES